MSLITGSIGRLLRVVTFTTSGTWTKGKDVGLVNVKVIGGGGGSGIYSGTTSGTASSFGSHCTANGGVKGAATAGGAGGSATGGDINLSGETGFASGAGIESRSMSYFGKYGYGATNGETSGGAGGSGGYSEKIIQDSSLGSTEIVTVGSGGSGGSGGVYGAGGAGIVIIYEYSK
jgi:hypothetical protein